MLSTADVVVIIRSVKQKKKVNEKVGNGFIDKGLVLMFFKCFLLCIKSWGLIFRWI